MSNSSCVEVKLYCLPEVDPEPYVGFFDVVERLVRPVDVAGYFLWFDGSGLAIFNGADRRGVRLSVRDFEQRGSQALILAQACGSRDRPVVADVMAGWGVDGLSLARRGCRVTLVERSPVVWAMLNEFVARVGLPVDVVYADAREWIEQATPPVDVIYLDPMFATRRKAALPSKRMQVLQDLAWQEDVALAELIEIAQTRAADRVVVKRRAKDPLIAIPDWQVKGRQVRFDVYRSIK